MQRFKKTLIWFSCLIDPYRYFQLAVAAQRDSDSEQKRRKKKHAQNVVFTLFIFILIDTFQTPGYNGIKRRKNQRFLACMFCSITSPLNGGWKEIESGGDKKLFPSVSRESVNLKRFLFCFFFLFRIQARLITREAN